MFLHVSVIHSVHGGGVRGCSWGGCAWLLGGACVVAPGACMVAPGGYAWLLGGCMVSPGGMRGCSRGVHGCSQGACMVAQGLCGFSGEGSMRGCSGGHAWDTTRYADMVNERPVRILLECILVLQASVILSMVGDGMGLASQHASQVI